MSLFKKKNKFNLINDSRITLDAFHNKKMKDLDKGINVKSVKLNKKKKDISKLLDKLLKIPNNKLTDEQMNKKFKYMEELKSIDTSLQKINDDYDDYILNTGHILYKYYDNKEQNNSVKKGLDFFINNDKKKSIKNQKTLVDEYMHIVSPDKIKLDTVNTYYCVDCNCNKEIHSVDGCILCPKCGNTEILLIESDKIAYKDTPKEITSFSYKRINHLNELIAQFQGKESTDIPKEIYKNIINELEKEKYYNSKNITYDKIKSVLKKLDYNRYYENIPHIINKITGVPLPKIPYSLEEQLRNMFKEVQVPFMKHCPTDRKNFLSYSYILYKFFELLEKDEMLPYLNLLKSREKLHEQDIVWKKICKDLKWEFIKSI